MPYPTSLFTSQFPGRYIQGPGALSSLPGELERLGTKAIALADTNALAAIEKALPEAGRHGITLIPTPPVCTMQKIEDTLAQIRRADADIIIGLGGGKVIDLGRATAGKYADEKKQVIPFVSVPTVAASDAPCSSLAVIYDEQDRVVKDLFVKRPPALVVVDSDIIIRAPIRTFIAGIGDALATRYEAESCLASGAHNFCGGQSTTLAQLAAENCKNVLFSHARQAVEDGKRQALTRCFEKVLEANILLSGIGFESVGVASAHAIHHGIAELPDHYHQAHNKMHGEKVAFGVLVSMILNQKPDQEIQDVVSLCKDIGLPTRLADFGISPDDRHALETIANRATAAGEIIYNEPVEIDSGIVIAAMLNADKLY